MSFLFHPRNAAFFHPANSFFYPGAVYTPSGYYGSSYPVGHRVHTRHSPYLSDPFEEFFADDSFFPRFKFARYVPDKDSNGACIDGTCSTGSCDSYDTADSSSTPLRESKGASKSVAKKSDETFGGFGELFRPNSFLSNNDVKFDVKDTDSSLSISGQFEGFDKGDFKVDFDHGNLIISAERKVESKDERTGAISRTYKSFSRSFPLPENIDKEGIRAKYTDDESRLTIEVPKTKPAEKPKETIVIN